MASDRDSRNQCKLIQNLTQCLYHVVQFVSCKKLNQLAESEKNDDQIFVNEILNIFSQTKPMFQAIMDLMDTFELMVKSPREITGNVLEQLFHYNGRGGILTEEKMNKLLNFLNNEGFQDAGIENRQPQQQRIESSSSSENISPLPDTSSNDVTNDINDLITAFESCKIKDKDLETTEYENHAKEKKLQNMDGNEACGKGKNDEIIAPGSKSTQHPEIGSPNRLFTNERRRMTANPLIKTNQSLPNNSRNLQTFGSNGLKHSKPQRRDTERNNGFNSRNPDTSHNHQALDQDDNWLCSHYKRHCYVKFDCCDKFWPCHRCHNNCGRKKLKSRDTKMVKCVYCNKEQPFGEFCCNCNAKFANYFCALCLHLTGKDDHPYHCEKCGICRIHGDRSFHCDVCGVCLDVQLLGNHKCREGFADDDCCICLEDVFTGCLILPCSHKVHKECATLMIRSGM
ncbi:uncharacterized protein LOC114532078 isoform X2 [Dendronephthya gigantea]|uniref:uncharacterized protein LOC114532078 isoform X2 n=1 Tax=Dendronephthya gigantea TaxID=151771 RepID=UPI00106C4BE7|nr:uncharacterized protein LOC114532078 isoform X2 [Dendronephthya gigantea]